MARYIDVDKLIEHIKDLPTWFKEDGWWHSTKYPNGHFDCDDVINSIDNAPTADVVEVVRCEDCKHRKNGIQGYYCDLTDFLIKDDDFCSHGERRDT